MSWVWIWVKSTERSCTNSWPSHDWIIKNILYRPWNTTGLPTWFRSYLRSASELECLHSGLESRRGIRATTSLQIGESENKSNSVQSNLIITRSFIQFKLSVMNILWEVRNLWGRRIPRELFEWVHKKVWARFPRIIILLLLFNFIIISK